MKEKIIISFFIKKSVLCAFFCGMCLLIPPITLNAQDQPPRVANFLQDIRVDEDSDNVVIDLTNVFTDPDNDDANIVKTLENNIRPQLVNVVINGNDMALDFQDDQSGFTMLTIKGTSNGQSVNTFVGVWINAIDDAPRVVNPVADVIGDEDGPNIIVDLRGVCEDVDGDIINYSIVNNSDEELLEVRMVNSLRVFINSLNDQNGQAVITVRATANNQNADTAFNVVIRPVNDIPYLANRIPMVIVDEDGPDSVIDLTNVFKDKDGDHITHSVVSNSNEGLVNVRIENNINLILDFQEDQIGESDIRIRGEANGENVETFFTARVNPVDDPPVVASPIGNIGYYSDNNDYTIDLTDVFTDEDSEDNNIVKTVQANTDQELVTVAINGNTLTLSDFANRNGIATITVRGISNGKSVDDFFDVTIKSVEYPPFITNDGTDEKEWFGYSIAVSGKHAVIGAVHNREVWAGVGTYLGRAYFYEFGVNGWQRTKSIAGPGWHTGLSVDIAGNKAVVNTDRSHSALFGWSGGKTDIYEYDGNEWVYQNLRIFGPHDKPYGGKTALSGNMVAVKCGKAIRIYNHEGEILTTISNTDHPDSRGFGCDLLIKDNLVYICDSDIKVVYIYDAVDNWRKTSVNAPVGMDANGFGYEVAIHDDNMIVGAWDSVLVYERRNGNWEFLQKLEPSDKTSGFGRIGLGIYGDMILVGAALGRPGAVYMFVKNGNQWEERKKIGVNLPVNNGSVYCSIAISETFALLGFPNSNDGKGCMISLVHQLVAPQNVTATNSQFENKIRISWTPVAGAVSYEVYRHTENNLNNAVRIANQIQAVSFDDLNVEQNKTYFYWIKAINGDVVSGFSGADAGNVGFPPVVANQVDNIVVDEDAADTVVDITDVFTDQDNNDADIIKTVQVNSNQGLVRVEVRGNQLMLDYQPNQNGVADITVRGNSNGLNVDEQFRVTVNPIDDAPVTANQIPDQLLRMNSNVIEIDLSGVFTDIDNDNRDIVKTVVSNTGPGKIQAGIQGDSLTLSCVGEREGAVTVTVRGTSGNQFAEDGLKVSFVPAYNLTINNGNGSGSYEAGTQIQVSAVPPTKTDFVCWTGDVGHLQDENSSDTVVIMPAGDVTVTARCKLVDEEPQKYELNVVNGFGSGNYSEKFVVTIDAIPPDGKIFDRWTGDTDFVLEVDNQSTTVNMPAKNITVTALFQNAPVDTFNLTVLNGTGSGAYKIGENVTVSADASDTMTFVQWLGDTEFLAQTTEVQTTLTMPSRNVTVTASYESVDDQAVLTLVTSPEGAGSVNSNLDAVEGESIQIEAVENSSDYIFFKWSVPENVTIDDSLSARTTVVFNGSATVTAIFAQKIDLVYASLVLDSSKINRDKIIIKNAQLKGLEDLNANSGPIIIHIDGHEYSLERSSWQQSGNPARGLKYIYKSSSEKISAVLDLNKNSWSFKAMKTNIVDIVDNSDGVTIVIGINGNYWGNRYVMDENTKWSFNGKGNDLSEDLEGLNGLDFDCSLGNAKLSGRRNSVKSNRDFLSICSGEISIPEFDPDNVKIIIDTIEIDVPELTKHNSRNCYQFKGEVDNGQLLVKFDLDKGGWSMKLKKFDASSINDQDGIDLILQIGNYTAGKRININKSSKLLFKSK